VQIEHPTVEPAPDPPPVQTNLLASVQGNGSIVTVSSTRGLSGEPPRQPVRCGVNGTACLSEMPPGSTMTMRAVPASGYRFAGWRSGCAGRKVTCTFTAGGSLTAAPVSAAFEPQRPNRALVVRLRPPSIKATFKASVGKGSMRVDGSISLRARLRIQLRRPGGGPLLTRNVNALGSFRLKTPLTKLANGARLFPGAFVLSLTGRAGSTPVPLQMRTVFVRSPLEGVVRSAYPATLEDGVKVNPIPRGSRQLWAVFRFASQPQFGPITASWYDLNGKFVGTVRKNNRPVISTGIRSATSGPIPTGAYRVVLKAGKRTIKTVRIRVA
jgi:Divergent InlB B-repeat domain